MDLIIQILLSILLAVGIGLLIYLFFFLRNVSASLKTVENESKKISQDLRSLLTNIEELTKRLNGVTIQIDEQMKNLDWLMNSIKVTTSEFIAIKDKVMNIVEEPVENLTRNFDAIKTGLKTFWNKLLKR